MSTILGKRKSLTTAGPDSGQLPASDALPGAFQAMQPAAAANTGEDDAESQDESGDEDTNQMSLADAQFEAELPASMQLFWDHELEVLQVRARMRPRPVRTFADLCTCLPQNATADTDFTRHDLPIARIRRIMRQDACENPRVRAPPPPTTHWAASTMYGPLMFAVARADDRERWCADPGVWCVATHTHVPSRAHTSPVGLPVPSFLSRTHPATRECPFDQRFNVWSHSMRALHPLADGACMGVHGALQPPHVAAARPALRRHELAHV